MRWVCSRAFAKVNTKTPTNSPKYIEARSIVVARKNVDRRREEKRQRVISKDRSAGKRNGRWSEVRET
jgi:hypothetical protein